MTYSVVICRTLSGYKASVPDLPECVAEAGTLEETQRLIREVVEKQVQKMKERGERLPLPSTHIDHVTLMDDESVARENVA